MMEGQVKVFESPQTRRDSMGDGEVLDLTALVVLHDHTTSDLLTFCYWNSQVVGQAMHFLASTYDELGFGPRDHWVFWAPLGSPDGKDWETVFAAHREGMYWRYQLYFYGDDELHVRLADCVLRSGVGLDEEYRSIIGRPQRGDDGVSVTWFEVLVPAEIMHTLSLLTAAQFR